MRNIFFAMIAAAVLVGANANAALPESYEGAYAGKFERAKGTVNVTVEGNLLRANFVGNNGSNDLLGGGCNAKIGPMMDIDLDDKDGVTVIDHATFAFDPGSCPHVYQGRSISVDFKHKNGAPASFNMSLFAYQTYDTVWQCWVDKYGHQHCTPHQQLNNWYATGSFKK